MERRHSSQLAHEDSGDVLRPASSPLPACFREFPSHQQISPRYHTNKFEKPLHPCHEQTDFKLDNKVAMGLPMGGGGGGGGGVWLGIIVQL